MQKLPKIFPSSSSLVTSPTTAPEFALRFAQFECGQFTLLRGQLAVRGIEVVRGAAQRFDMPRARGDGATNFLHMAGACGDVLAQGVQSCAGCGGNREQRQIGWWLRCPRLARDRSCSAPA